MSVTHIGIRLLLSQRAMETNEKELHSTDYGSSKRILVLSRSLNKRYISTVKVRLCKLMELLLQQTYEYLILLY